MSDIKVSVIVPVYNAEKYLEKCINSIINQTLKDIEIIAVDDGSADRSLEILNNFQKKDGRIKVLTQQNKFAGAARNKGMEFAFGKYLVFWDSDDFFEKNALEILYKKCEAVNADICLCGAYSYNSETGKRAVNRTFLKSRFLPKEKVFSKETCPQYIFNIASNVPWQRMFRAEFIKSKNIRFQNLQKANDTYFVMAAMFYAEKITFTEKPLVNYRENTAQGITATVSKNPLCAYESYAAVYELLKNEKPSELVWQSFYNRLLSGLFRSVLLQTTQEGMETVYNKIKFEGLDYFGINNHTEESYYYFPKEYADLTVMKSHTCEEYLMYKYKKALADNEFYKSKAEQKFSVKAARKISRFVKADSKLFDFGKKILHFR